MVDLGQKGVRSRERLFKNSHTKKPVAHTTGF
jgi:hypothetical protein